MSVLYAAQGCANMIQIRIIPEPHIRDSNLQTRTDYLEEIRGYMTKIKIDLSDVRGLLGADDKLVVIFDGDVFDRYFRDLTCCMEWIKFFVDLNRITMGNVYSVVGNHEITYKRQNLFWMIANVQSDWIKEGHILTEDIFSFSKLIQVVDELQVGNILFIFGHYMRDLSHYTTEWVKEKYPEVTEVVLISHNEMLSKSIIKHFQDALGFDLVRGRSGFIDIGTAGLLPPTDMLKSVYVGHMHKAYGELIVDEQLNGVNYHFTLSYLASLGRTNVEEVSNSFLQRTIPVITIDETGVDYAGKHLKLEGEEIVVNTELLMERREAYNAKAEIRSLDSADISLTDPLEDLKRIYSSSPASLSMVYNAIENKIPADLTEILDDCHRVSVQYGFGGR